MSPTPAQLDWGESDYELSEWAEQKGIETVSDTLKAESQLINLRHC